jgi:hypothetical protein
MPYSVFMAIQNAVGDVVGVHSPGYQTFDTRNFVFSIHISLQNPPDISLVTTQLFVVISPVGLVMLDIIEILRVIIGIGPLKRAVTQYRKRGSQ